MGVSMLELELIDRGAYERAIRHFSAASVALPTFGELAEPGLAPRAVREQLAGVDPDAPNALNLFRVHWRNGASRRDLVATPEHVVLPPSLTGVEAPIVVALGDRFPMIRAHKVLAAYACLVPRIVTGQFDPTVQRAVWPSTGNYCRGGVAISRILGCRGVAVLPMGMSEERFRWLERWVQVPADIVRTPGSERNVKEIYDACRVLARDPANVVINQFREFGNHLAHYLCTGRAMEEIFEAERAKHPGLKLAAFVSATGSAGTIGAGDYLKDRFGARIVAAEALECPTMLENGFGEHNIQGIGDQHIPYIHNVMNTDVVTAVSDRTTDELGVLFNSPAGREHLTARRGVSAAAVEALRSFGLSSICNLIAAVKVAKHLRLGPGEAVLTVATDGADLYESERRKTVEKRFPRGFGAEEAAGAFARHVLEATDDHVLALSERDRRRIFNLGYFTWVEQQGVSPADFEARRSQDFWNKQRELLPAWNQRIEEFNRRAGTVS